MYYLHCYTMLAVKDKYMDCSVLLIVSSSKITSLCFIKKSLCLRGCLLGNYTIKINYYCVLRETSF